MALLQYDISVTGVNAVEAAFGRIEARIGRLNRLSESGGIGGTSRSTTSGAVLNKDALSGVAAQKSADREAARSAKEAARERANAAREAARAEKQAAREVKQAQQEQLRLTKEIAQEEIKAARAVAAARNEAARASRAAASRDGQRRYDRFARIAGGVGSTVGGLGKMAMGVTGLGGTALFATAAHNQMESIAAASRLANQFSENGATLGSIRQMKGELLAESASVRGFTRGETLAAMATYHEKTGEAGSARRMVKGMGDLALATGTEINDIAGFGSTIHNVFKTSGMDAPEAEAKTMALLTHTAALAKEKSIEMRNFASVGGAVVAQAPLLTGDVSKNMELGMSIAQLAIAGGAAGPEEAATSYQNMILDLVKHQKQMKKMGIGNAIKDGKLDLENALVGILGKTNGDIDKATKVFNIRGLRAFNGLGMMYRAAEEKKKGSGESAVRAELGRLGSLTLSKETIEAGARSRLEDPDMQFKAAMGKLNQAIGQELVPVITKLIPKLTEAAPALGQFAKALAAAIEWFMKNPLTGIAAVISGAIVKEIASAAIGDAIKRILTRTLAGDLGGSGAAAGTGSGAGGGAARVANRTSALGILSAVGIGAAVGVPLASAIYEGGVNATVESRKEAEKDLRGITDITAAGGQFDKPFDLGGGITVSSTHPADVERQKKADTLGMQRTNSVLRQISDARQKLDMKDSERSLGSLTESAIGIASKLSVTGLMGDVIGGLGLGGFEETGKGVDLTGREAREEERKLLAEREKQALSGAFSRADIDLEKLGYSTEANDQGNGTLKVSGEKLTSAADALNQSAHAIMEAASQLPRGEGSASGARPPAGNVKDVHR